MKKFFKIVCAVFLDIVFVYLTGVFLSHLVHFLHLPISSWAYYLFVMIGYLVFGFCNHWKTLGVKLLYFKRDKNKPSLLFSVLSVIVDLFVAFSMTILIDRVLIQFVFFDSLLLFWIVTTLYYMISYCFSNQTIGKYLFLFQINQNGCLSKSPLKVTLKRETVKFGLGFWLPLLILYYLFNFTNLYIDSIIVIVINLLFLLLYFTVKDESWWDTLSKVQKNHATRNGMLIYPIFLLFVVSVFIILLIYNNINNTSTHKILGFKFPVKRIEHPYNSKVEPYYHFLKEKGQNPKDYLLSLFDKYDIVVLCENLHPEDTQWDFIYDVISDKRFYENVGTVFTEYGCAREQAKVDTFMQTIFDSDTDLQKATATLMNYHSGNFYYFMGKLYKLNQSLPDSLKIKEHFTSVYGWKYLCKAYHDSINFDWGNPFEKEYDSFMAQVVINWYNKEKKKCLVVTNFRHAFIVNNNNITPPNRNFTENEAQYIYNQFPKQTVNVMLFGSSYKSVTYKPIHNGIWNAALKKTGYTPVGFDFKDSPFGKDYFDKIPFLFKPYPYTYADIFTGFVFYKPEEEFTYSKQPYKRYAAEEEYKFALRHNFIDTVRAKEWVNRYDNEGGQYGVFSFFNIYISSYHFADLLIWFIWALFVVFILVTRFFYQLCHKKYK